MDKHIAALEELAEDLREWGDGAALRGFADRLTAAIALMRGQSWQDISTVPLMADVLLFHPAYGKGKRPAITKEFTGCHRDHADDGYTHWQPLPTPPKDPADEQ